MDNNSYLWSPPDWPKSPIKQFIKIVESKFGFKISSYWDLHKWSVEHYDKFWEEVWHFCNVKSSNPYNQVVDTTKRIDEFPSWFDGAKLNYAENILKFPDPSKVAIYFAGEVIEGEVRSVTFGELKNQVQKYAAALKSFGVKVGDRVAGYMPNCPECVIAMLATSSLGAVWSSTSPDFGTMGVLDRLTQVQPKVLFSVEAVVYNQKTHDHLDKLREVVSNLPSLERVVIIPFVHDETVIDISAVPNSLFINEFLKHGCDVDGTTPALLFEQLPFSHPLFIMFSSGTTGPPKCIVHSAGGTLLKHLEEHAIQQCLTKDDVVMFYTTVGWMMWNWLVSALATGASIVLYDGSPFLPSPDVLFTLVDKIGKGRFLIAAHVYINQQ